MPQTWPHIYGRELSDEEIANKAHRDFVGGYWEAIGRLQFEFLRDQGLRGVEAAVVHAIFAQGAGATLRRAGIRRIVSCDTVVHPTNAISTALSPRSCWSRIHTRLRFVAGS